jgi:glycosyltransferase involved in cell wall biosynthesis
MRVLVLPRDLNPYQHQLYGEMQRLGVQITYIGGLTRSGTLNLLLLLPEIAVQRLAGARLIHLHWLFTFRLPGRRFRIMRRMAYIWFLVWLRTCRILGMRLVWTAHNVLPHEPILADDISARRALVRASDLVVAHSQSTLAELDALDIVPHRSAVIPHGSSTLSLSAPLRLPGAGGGIRKFLFFGHVRNYKGVDDLLTAFLAIPGDVAAHLTVAGQCDDPMLRSSLCTLARSAGTRIELRLERVPDDELPQLLAAADVVVLPFRRVTTSGSAMLALSYGRPLIVPDLAMLVDLPDLAVVRYGGHVQELTAAITRLARADGEVLASMSAAARAYASKMTWPEVAERTWAELSIVLNGLPQSDGRGQSVTTQGII